MCRMTATRLDSAATARSPPGPVSSSRTGPVSTVRLSSRVVTSASVTGDKGAVVVEVRAHRSESEPVRPAGNRESAPASALFPAVVPAAAYLVVVLGLSAWSLWFGGAGWPLWLIVWLGVGALIADRTDWFLGIAAGPVLGLFLVTMLLRVTPFLGIGIALPVLVVHLAVGVVVGVLLWRRGVFVPLTRLLRPLREVAVASLSAIAGLAAVLAIVVLPGRWNIAWVTSGDSITSLMFSRYMFGDGGISPERTNPVPVPYSVIAAAMGPGRDGIPPEEYLRHDIGQLAQLWILVLLGSAVLAGAIVVASRGRGSWWFTTPLAVAAGALPLSWFVAGNALQFGFFNAALACFLLLAGWLLFLRAEHHPVWGYAVLTVAITVLLGTWGPVAIVLGSVLLVILFRNRRILTDRSSRPRFAIVVLATAQMVGYALFVTVPDFLREQSALSADGGIFASTSNTAIAVGAALVVIAACAQQHRARSHTFAGVLALVGAGALLVVLFVGLRHAVANPWGYYPAKFAWLLEALAFVVILALVAQLLGSGAKYVAGVRFALTAGGIVLVGSLAWQITPLGPETSEVSPLVTVWRQTGIAASGDALDLAMRFATPGEKNILVGYADPSTDAYVNSWTLQINTSAGTDPIRISAYALDVTKVDDVCTAIERFDGGATIRTRDASLESTLRSRCADQDFSVVLER